MIKNYLTNLKYGIVLLGVLMLVNALKTSKNFFAIAILFVTLMLTYQIGVERERAYNDVYTH